MSVCRSRSTGSQLQEGSASLELVIVFPVVLLLIFGIVQAGLYYHARSIALAAAQAGAQAASVRAATDLDGTAAASAFAQRVGGGLLDPTVRVNRSATHVRVNVAGNSATVLPGWSGFRVQQSSTLPIERVAG